MFFFWHYNFDPKKTKSGLPILHDGYLLDIVQIGQLSQESVVYLAIICNELDMSRGQSYNSPGALLSHKFPRPTLCAAANNTSLINPPPVCPNQMASQPKSCFNVNCPRHKGTCKGQNVGDGVGSTSL